ncbi:MULTISPECIES: MFS transporter [unclassified Nostoc]|uniref:MFS transporter n=1 Tax=unclassified Nostoc TaxID=2593658 RepID=UPI002AD4DC34|nr:MULTISPECIES: MFS transporter [unclassified Nostoc]MDZ8125538.1 MFS transporter [Nostoc sp. CmiVER01]MDZ8221975.1 MFS transporter [Nostoc sp. ChiVER01]
MQKQRKPSNKSLRSLDYLNVFLADVRDGVGPYLSIYLKASANWNPAQIGLAMSASAIATVIAQTPAGALVDRLRQKRMLIVLAAVFVSIGSIAMGLFPNLPVVIGSQIMIGIAAAIFPPAIAAITLGLVGHERLDRRVGRNETFNHTGNLLAATLAGLVGYFIARKAIFFLVAAMAVGSIISVRMIREREIDHELARGDREEGEEEAKEEHQQHHEGILQLLSDRRILFFSIAVVLFHFANAAMLPLVGQELAQGKGTSDTVYMSACIIVAQLVMIPVSNLAGRFAHTARKPIFLLGFAVLPIRGVLYTFSGNPYFLVSVQILDGIAGGIFGVLSVLMVADLTKGTGRFNVTQGMLNTAIGIGAGLSNVLAGFVVKSAGYNVGFLILAAIAVVALAVFWFCVPETKTGVNRKASPQTA